MPKAYDTGQPEHSPGCAQPVFAVRDKPPLRALTVVASSTFARMDFVDIVISVILF